MNHRHVIVISIVTLLVVAAIAPAQAKDLTQRIGVGYNSQLGFGILGGAFDDAFTSSQAISVKYWATREIGVEGLLGFTSAKFEDDRGFGATIGGKFLYNLILEEQMNVYTGGGLGLIPVSVDVNDDADSNVGVMAEAFFGWEFFLQGLPNLGFDVEVGLQYVDYDQYSQFGTYGGGFGMLGIHYYF